MYKIIYVDRKKNDMKLIKNSKNLDKSVSILSLLARDNSMLIQ